MKPPWNPVVWALALSLMPLACRQSDEASRPQEIAPARDSLAARLDAALSPQATDVDVALDLARQAAASAEERRRDDPLELAGELNALGRRLAAWCGATRGAWSFAEQLMRQARELRRASGEEGLSALAESLSSLGVLSYFQGRWQDAEDYHRQALQLRRGALPAGSLEIGDSLLELALTHFQEARFDDAEEELKEAESIYSRAQPKPAVDGLAEVFRTFAELRRVQNNYVDAETALAKARDYAVKAEMDDWFMAELANNLAGLYRDQGEFYKAELEYAQALAIFESSPEICGRDLAMVHLNLGEMYRLQGDDAKAEQALAKALAMALSHRAEGDPNLAFFLNRNAALYEERGELEVAADFYRQALAVSQAALAPDHPQVALQLHDLAGVYVELGRLSEAEDLYREALGIWERTFGRDYPESAHTLTKLARCLMERGETAAARRLLDEAIGFFSASPQDVLPEVEAEAFWLRAQLHKRAGDRSQAFGDLERSLRIVESLRLELGEDERRQIVFLARYAEAYRLLADWRLEDEGELDRAVEAMERSRSRSLVGQLLRANVRLWNAEPGDDEIAARKRAAELGTRIGMLQEETPADDGRKQTLRALRRELLEAREALKRFDEQAKRGSRLWQMTAGAPPIPLSAIQADLVPSDASLLMYQIGASASHLVVVPRAPQAATAVALEVSPASASVLGVAPGALTREKLRQILDGDGGLLMELSTRPGRRGTGAGGETSLGARLYGLFRSLMPETVWKTVRTQALVIVMPDGALHRLPFEALVTQPVSAAGKSHWWIDDGPYVHYTASAGVLDVLARRGRSRNLDAPPGPFVLSVVDPALDPAQRARFGDLPPLPGARQEGRAILEAFGGPESDAVKSLQGPEALESAVRQAVVGKRYLHFATHGVVAEHRNRLFATLLLTPTPNASAGADDGFLELPEIYRLELDSELAVLSACSTQVGKYVEGEGVFSLSRGFLIAGAQRVMASLWQVEDASTAELVSRVFEEISADEAEAREPRYVAALRRARCEVRKRPEWHDPYYWAPFILIGESPLKVEPPEPCASS